MKCFIRTVTMLIQTLLRVNAVSVIILGHKCKTRTVSETLGHTLTLFLGQLLKNLDSMLQAREIIEKYYVCGYLVSTETSCFQRRIFPPAAADVLLHRYQAGPGHRCNPGSAKWMLQPGTFHPAGNKGLIHRCGGEPRCCGESGAGTEFEADHSYAPLSCPDTCVCSRLHIEHESSLFTFHYFAFLLK